MNPDRLTQLVLDRRFGALTPAEAADLSAARRLPEAASEVAQLEALLDHAPTSAVGAKAEFSGALAARIDAAALSERRWTWRTVFLRAAVAYAGIAAGALIYAGLNGWFGESTAAADVISGYSAALDFPGRLPR